MKKKNIEIVVLEKSDYDLIRIIKGNRPVEERRIKLTTNSINEIGMIGEVFASKDLFDKTGLYYIVDGQSRVSSLLKLEKDIPIRLLPGDPYKLLTFLNRNQKQFRLENFVSVYACKDDHFSIAVQETMNAYKVKSTVAFHACFGNRTSGSFNQRYMSGQNIPLWSRRIEFMVNLSSLDIPFKYDQTFLRAYMKAFKCLQPKYLKKLNINMIMVRRGHSESDYITAFENIINRGVSKNNIICIK